MFGNVQGHAGCSSEQPGLAEGVPSHSRGSVTRFPSRSPSNPGHSTILRPRDCDRGRATLCSPLFLPLLLPLPSPRAAPFPPSRSATCVREREREPAPPPPRGARRAGPAAPSPPCRHPGGAAAFRPRRVRRWKPSVLARTQSSAPRAASSRVTKKLPNHPKIVGVGCSTRG